MVPKLGLYAYGVVGEGLKQLNILGIDKENKVFWVEDKGLAVAVSKIDTQKFQDQVKEGLSQLAKAEGILRAHEEVVETLAKLTTIIPFRFGTILKNKKAALVMLQGEKERFKNLLSKLTGKEEWGIKVYADSQKLEEYFVKNEPEFKKQAEQKGKLSSGAAYLLGRKMEEELKNEVNTRLGEITKVIFKKAEKYANESQINKILPQKLTGKDKQMVLNSAYLVEKEKITNFSKQIKRLKEEYEPFGLELEVSGPWPAYSFS